mgnify:FL=1
MRKILFGKQSLMTMFKDHLVRFGVRIGAVGGLGQCVTWLFGVDDEAHVFLEQYWPVTVGLLILFGFWSLVSWDMDRERRKAEFEERRKVRRRRRG